MMDRQITHVVRLVDDLLDVSRISRGKIELCKELLELTDVVQRTVQTMRSFLDERQQQLDMTLCDEALNLEADPARLEQIVSNLLTNAAKYTPPGGRIELRVQREGTQAVLHVKDNGIGIRPEMLPRIFDMFQQADRLPGRVSEGLGLGLCLVRSLVELHGGTVAAFSEEPNRGSEFVVRLPALTGTRKVVAPMEPAAPSQAGPTLRILVVDDNVDGARSLAKLLRLDGHQVDVAHDGPAALQMTPTLRPDVILLDIGLPKGMDGYEVARHLRQQPEMKTSMLIALTGFGQDEDRRRSSAAGFQAHLVKPMDPKMLRELLRNCSS